MGYYKSVYWGLYISHLRYLQTYGGLQVSVLGIVHLTLEVPTNTCGITSQIACMVHHCRANILILFFNVDIPEKEVSNSLVLESPLQ